MAITTLASAENLANLFQRVRSAKQAVKGLAVWMENQSAQLKTERDNVAGLLQQYPDLVSAAVKQDLVALGQIVNRVTAALDQAALDVRAATEAEAGNLD